MKILESAPHRYDIGIRLLTFGRLDKAYDRLVNHIERGQQVPDIGCGTGALTLRAARRGAHVKGIDVNAQMLEIARQRANKAGLTESVDLVEMGVAELGSEEARHYDAVMSVLCLSELGENELTFTLKEVERILHPGGLLLIADEVRPQGLFKRLIHLLIRAPLSALVYAITQATTHPVSDLPEKLKDAGLSIVSVRLNLLGSFGEFVCLPQKQKPADVSS